MSAIRLRAEVRDLFLDAPRVVKSMDAASRKALARSGGLIRQTARRSMRYRKLGVAAPPGSPPFAHRDSGRYYGQSALLRRLMFFTLTPDKRSVVVGPLGGNTRVQVPGLHEYGGATRRVVKGRGGKRRVVVRSRYPERPYMRPALQTSADSGRLSGFWKDSLR